MATGSKPCTDTLTTGNIRLESNDEKIRTFYTFPILLKSNVKFSKGDFVVTRKSTATSSL